MKKNLIKTARQLIPPSLTQSNEFAEKCDTIAAKATNTLLVRKDLDKLIGKGNKDMAADNNRNFARFMTALFTDYSPEVFVDTVLWVYTAYRSHGFQTTYWATNLNIWMDHLKTDLSKEAFSEIYPFYNWLIINIPIFSKMTDETVSGTPKDIHH